jgi:hypothetical protein
MRELLAFTHKLAAGIRLSEETGQWVLGIDAGECPRIGGFWHRFDPRLRRLGPAPIVWPL